MPDRFFHLTDQGQRRSSNQDHAASVSLPGGYILLVVADGVGGAGGGETASDETVNAFVATMWADEIAEPEVALAKALDVANRRVRELQKTDPRLANMATTLVSALIRGDDAWVINVGDSRGYRLRDGMIEALTQDDSWIMEQVRAGAMTEEEAAKSPYQNVITRGVGVEEELMVERIVHERLSEGDVLFLCSDGLYRAVEPEVIAKTLIEKPLANKAAERLIELANEAGGPDNISIALYRHVKPVFDPGAPTISS
ncbi:MAG: protein phosphatase 2C domain-containing protein [Dehalococcoidia bacterium]|nr:serine/threonine-protein phosphatase [Dehalococcoidia bacterium]MCB9485178.1 serine/threonine-protein phosphatase [Thermoflexaceae bacterium]